ncbi:MAG TPA: diguanylate cyclase [Catenuloplanes sp.]
MVQWQPVALLFAASTVGSAVAFAIMWPRRRANAAATALTLTLLALAEWSAVKTFGAFSMNVQAKQVFEAAMYPGVCGSIVGFLCYSLAMTDRSWTLSKRMAVLLCIEPAMVITAAATNGWHHRFYASDHLIGTFGLLAPRPAIGFWLHTAYSYTIMFTAFLILLRNYVQSPESYRRQFAWPLVGFVPPMTGNIVTVMLLPAGKSLGVTPVFFTVSAAACCWALFHRALPDLVPIAARQILQAVSQAVIVIDRSTRVLELNPAAVDLLRRVQPDAATDVSGLPAGSILGLDRALAGGADTEYTVTAPNGERFDLNVRISGLTDRGGRFIGWVLVAHDVTEHHRQRRVLHATNNELREQLGAVERLRAELAEVAVRDALTGLHNRRHLIDILDQQLTRARLNGSHLSLVLVDIDHFKAINDTFGHLVGDHVLCAVAERLAAVTGEGETVARYGGEEFVVVLPGCSAQQARERAEALRRHCAELPVEVNGAPALNVTVSAGVAGFRPGQTAASFIDAADRALYTAKALGRNRVEIAPIGFPAATPLPW